jgi:glyoxylate reductase
MSKLIGITRNIPDSGILYLRHKGLKVKVWPYTHPPSEEQLISFLTGCDGMISMLSDQISKAFLEKLPALKIISNYAAGYNNIDLSYCAKQKIKITNTPEVLTEATAELTLALLLSVSRKIIPAYLNVQTNEWKSWNPTGFIGIGLQGKTLGIIGPGRIAFEFSKKCRLAFDMNINYYGRTEKENFNKKLSAKKLPLVELLKTSDVISIHCPLTEDTKYLISKKEIEQMKSQCILLNTARGEVINQQDLEQAIVNDVDKSKFFGIGLDVTDPEPLSIDSPLLKDDRVVVVPHIGSANRESREAMSLLCAKNIEAFFNNDPLLTEISSSNIF